VTKSINPLLGMASLGGVLLAWSFGPTLSKQVTTHPVVSCSVRMVVACLLQWAVCVALNLKPSPALLRKAALPGALFCVNNILFFMALGHASVATTSLLTSLQPIVVLFVAQPLFGERVTPWDVSWTVVALGGAAVAVIGANAGRNTVPTSAYGVVLGLGSMLAFSGYFLVGKLQNSHATEAPPNPFTYMTAILTSSAVTSLPFLFLWGRAGDVTRIDIDQATALGLVIVVPTIGHLFMTFSHRHVDASISSLVLLVQPISSALVAWWILQQRVVWAQAAGGVIVVAGIASVTLRRRSIAASATASSVTAGVVAAT
jgi:drug/metabolite transporter (DMT)-like permease